MQHDDTERERAMNEQNEIKGRKNFEWIKSESTGRSYLCPEGALPSGRKPTEKELECGCVDESENPQND
jgi:hypothetical protein